VRKRFIAAAAVVCLAGLPLALASIDGTTSIQFQINDRRQVGLNPGVNISVNPTPSLTFSNGSAAGQANQLFQANRTFSGTTDALKLSSAGTLVDGYGTPVTLVRVKAIYFQNTGTSSIVIGAGTAPMTTWLNAAGTMTIPAGGFFLCVTPDATGWTITATTADTITVTGTSGQTYSVGILGATS
jgi:hypothetical protein